MAELLGGTPPVQAEVTGPGPKTAIISGAVALVMALFAPHLSPIIAAAWIVGLASQVRFHVWGGGTPPISAEELTEWMALYRLEPWGEERGDMRAALIASIIANVNRDPKKRPQPYELKDFMLKFEPDPPPDPENVWAKIEAWARSLGASSEGG